MYRKTNYIANPSFRLKRGVWENSIRLRTFILLIGLFIVRTGYSLDTRSDSIDIKNIKLDLSFANFSAKTLYGKTTLSIESKLQNVVGIDLDLLKLTVDSVLFNNQQISFSYNDSVIGIRFPQSLNIHQNATIQVCYHGTPYQNPADFGGFYWNATYAFNIGVSFLANPPNYGKVWFPCFDNFVERSKFQFSITTDSTQAAFCNGILDSSSTNGNTKLWHWSLHEEIPSYLAGIAVSDYQTLSDTVIGANGVIPIRLNCKS
jgi:aminopeptidase N